MGKKKVEGLHRPTQIRSRRNILKLGAVGAGAFLSAPFVLSSTSHAREPKLSILQWKHFVPGYDAWFNNTFVAEWSARTGIEVTVDQVGLSDIGKVVAGEAAAGAGHDLLMLLAPPAVYEDKVIDHREIYEESANRYGEIPDIALKSTYNPVSGRYFGFCTAYAPALITYRRDLWDSVGATPDTWDEVWRSGRRIKLLHQNPVGISLAPEHNSEHTLRAILTSFGGTVQNTDGVATLSSNATREAVKFVTALFQEAMHDDVLNWNPTSNNTFMLSGEYSLTVDTLSIARAGEAKRLDVADKLWLAPAPEGPAGRFAPSFGIHSYFIWKFAEHPETAKQFLVDYIGASRDALLASGFQNMPIFGNAVPDLAQILGDDPTATRPDKYASLAHGADWTTNIGFPGYTNAATVEVLNRRLISRMFAQAATGRITTDEAVSAAASEVKAIFDERRV